MLHTYIDKNDIIKYVDQLQVWWWLLGFQVDEGEFFKNPFRVDNNPGCKLSKGIKWITLKDYADSRFHNWNIFQATMYKYGVGFNKACYLIWDEFIFNKDRPLIPQTRIEEDNIGTERCHIHFIPYLDKNGKSIFLERDKAYWSPLSITSDQLREDFTYSVKMFRFNDKQGRMFQVYPNSHSYALTQPSGNVKIYCPDKTIGKWTSNCDEYDIGFLDRLPKSGDYLFICKSYKDCRIQINAGYNAVWIQGERFLIPDNIVYSLVKRFNNILIYFDNDDTGIDRSLYLADHCNHLTNTNKFRAVWLPEHLENIKDNADYILAFGEDALKQQLKSFL